MSESVFRRAAERLLEIIGEAANVIGDDTRAQHPEVAWTDVTRLRVVLPHRYHRVDADQVWVIARGGSPAGRLSNLTQVRLPSLIRELAVHARRGTPAARARAPR